MTTCPCSRWRWIPGGPLVFINLDSECEPLADWLEVIPELCGWAGFDDYVCAYDLSVKLPCNWKTLIEAFSETYHVQGVHREMLPSCDDVNSQKPALRAPTARCISPTAFPARGCGTGASNQEIWESLAGDPRRPATALTTRTPATAPSCKTARACGRCWLSWCASVPRRRRLAGRRAY